MSDFLSTTKNRRFSVYTGADFDERDADFTPELICAQRGLIHAQFNVNLSRIFALRSTYYFSMALLCCVSVVLNDKRLTENQISGQAAGNYLPSP